MREKIGVAVWVIGTVPVLMVTLGVVTVLLAMENVILWISATVSGEKFEPLSIQQFTKDIGRM